LWPLWHSSWKQGVTKRVESTQKLGWRQNINDRFQEVETIEEKGKSHEKDKRVEIRN
jgi:hypothetical protein